MARDIDKKGRGDGELGTRLRRRRKALGLAAKEVARVAGVSPSYVSQLEHGKQDRPSLDVLSALATALGVPTSELLGEPLTVIVAAETPPALASLAEDLHLDATTTALLAGIHIDGRRPATRDGWLLILLAIRQACGLTSDVAASLSAQGS